MAHSNSDHKELLRRAFEFFGYSEARGLKPDEVDKVKQFIWMERKKLATEVKRDASEWRPKEPDFKGTAIETRQDSQSPIEEILVLSMLTRSSLIGAFRQQVKIGPYFADVAFEDLKIVVEADGRDYHTDPAQIAKDQQRDKYMTGLGWTVFRFEGSEIHRDPMGVVDKIEKVVLKFAANSGAKEAWEK